MTLSSNPEHTNNLIHASSPYLLQHAHNPVNWEEWSPGLWQRARTENKMVLVSIGYSACHWCHVMEKECFEDVQSAEMMNNWFINVKVDREERPDVDMVYMDACQLMTGKGGWPLNVFCLPDGRPVYAGTYFPNTAWQQVLLKLNAMWTSDREKALEYAEKVQAGMKQMSLVELARTAATIRADLPALYETMSGGFDWDEGGPDRAPKFPLPNNYELLLDHYICTGNAETLDFVNLTLIKMANGGIYDQLRGGFCRYSTDKFWFAPHFEKMLYDNAQLISLYARAFAVTESPLYKDIVNECLLFCNNELKDATGLYYSALDADSDGVEGRYYVFTWNELQQALNSDELEFARIAYSCTEKGNWEHGFNILHKRLAPLQILEQLNLDVHSYHALMRSIKAKLLAMQENRNRPGLDYKTITSWNGLMIKALADAAVFLGDERYLSEAEKLADKLWDTQWKNDTLWRIYSKGKSSVDGFLEDYAHLAEGLLRLYSVSGNAKYAGQALLLVENTIKRFRDPETGVFYFTPADADPLVIRKTDLSDDVMNSSTSIMADVMQQLAVLYGKPAMQDMAAELQTMVRQQMTKYPAWYSNWARLAHATATGLLQLECMGENAGKAAEQLRRKLPSTAVISFTTETSALPVFEGKNTESGLRIYICLGQTCLEPVDTLEKAMELALDLVSAAE